jgi:hypothetical protein
VAAQQVLKEPPVSPPSVTEAASDLVTIAIMAAVTFSSTPAASSQAPAMPPPPGVTSNFVDPPSLALYSTTTIAVCSSLVTVVFSLRCYVRIWYKKVWTLEDCERWPPNYRSDEHGLTRHAGFILFSWVCPAATMFNAATKLNRLGRWHSSGS